MPRSLFFYTTNFFKPNACQKLCRRFIGLVVEQSFRLFSISKRIFTHMGWTTHVLLILQSLWSTAHRFIAVWPCMNSIISNKFIPGGLLAGRNRRPFCVRTLPYHFFPIAEVSWSESSSVCALSRIFTLRSMCDLITRDEDLCVLCNRIP